MGGIGGTNRGSQLQPHPPAMAESCILQPRVPRVHLSVCLSVCPSTPRCSVDVIVDAGGVGGGGFGLLLLAGAQPRGAAHQPQVGLLLLGLPGLGVVGTCRGGGRRESGTAGVGGGGGGVLEAQRCAPHPQHSLALEEAESEGEMSEAPSHCSRLMMAWLSATSKPSFSTLLSASGRDLNSSTVSPGPGGGKSPPPPPDRLPSPPLPRSSLTPKDPAGKCGRTSSAHLCAVGTAGTWGVGMGLSEGFSCTPPPPHTHTAPAGLQRGPQSPIPKQGGVKDSPGAHLLGVLRDDPALLGREELGGL